MCNIIIDYIKVNGHVKIYRGVFGGVGSEEGNSVALASTLVKNYI
jgi:hypothetical protein